MDVGWYYWANKFSTKNNRCKRAPLKFGSHQNSKQEIYLKFQLFFFFFKKNTNIILNVYQLYPKCEVLKGSQLGHLNENWVSLFTSTLTFLFQAFPQTPSTHFFPPSPQLRHGPCESPPLRRGRLRSRRPIVENPESKVQKRRGDEEKGPLGPPRAATKRRGEEGQNSEEADSQLRIHRSWAAVPGDGGLHRGAANESEGYADCGGCHVGSWRWVRWDSCLCL